MCTHFLSYYFESPVMHISTYANDIASPAAIITQLAGYILSHIYNRHNLIPCDYQIRALKIDVNRGNRLTSIIRNLIRILNYASYFQESSELTFCNDDIGSHAINILKINKSIHQVMKEVHHVMRQNRERSHLQQYRNISQLVMQRLRTTRAIDLLPARFVKYLR